VTREVRLAAAGHPAVTGRHDRTLELTAEDAITARATCILGVAAGPLPGDLPALRGRVRLTIGAAGRSAAVEGEVNPGFASAERLVVRRSDHVDPDTFLVNASASAADLPADLLAVLATPGEPITAVAEELADPPAVLLVLTPGAVPAEVARLAAQADLVVDLTGPGAAAPAVPLTAPRRHGLPSHLTGARTVVVLAADLADPVARTAALLPAARVVVWPPRPGADLLLAAGHPGVPLLDPGPALRRDPAARLAAAAVPTVLHVPEPPPADPAAPDPTWLTDLRAALPRHALLLPDPAVGWGVAARTVGPGEPAGDLRGLRRAPYAVLLPPPGRPPLAVDPAELARLLRAAGSTGRDTAAVLTDLGLPRKEAYRLATERTPPAPA
jgi:hypothetical protein